MPGLHTAIVCVCVSACALREKCCMPRCREVRHKPSFLDQVFAKPCSCCKLWLKYMTLWYKLGAVASFPALSLFFVLWYRGGAKEGARVLRPRVLRRYALRLQLRKNLGLLRRPNLVLGIGPKFPLIIVKEVSKLLWKNKGPNSVCQSRTCPWVTSGYLGLRL